MNKFDNFAFKNEIMKKTSKALKTLQENKIIKSSPVNSTYREFLIENKMIQDGNFLVSLGKKYLEPLNEASFKEFYAVIVESITIYNKLCMETDIQPKLISPALNYDKALTESTKLEIYKDYFVNNLNKKFSQPLLEGKLLTTYETETKLLLENIAVAEELNIDLDNFVKYALFESTLYDTLSNIIIPDFTKKEINKFITAQSPEYFEMFNENANILFKQLNENIQKLTLAIGPMMFNEANGINALNMDPTDPTGPLQTGVVVNSNTLGDQQVVTIVPDMALSDIGMGDEASNPADFITQSEEPTPSLPEEDIINPSTNDGNITDAPELETDKPYTPADKIPEIDLEPSTILDDLGALESENNILNLENEPEEYISVPVDQSYTEESSSIKPDELDDYSIPFTFSQFAGAMKIFRQI